MITHTRYANHSLTVCGLTRHDCILRGEDTGPVPTCLWCIANQNLYSDDDFEYALERDALTLQGVK
jgi:hypothetical protein